jgi:hypothetical protein
LDTHKAEVRLGETKNSQAPDLTFKTAVSKCHFPSPPSPLRFFLNFPLLLFPSLTNWHLQAHQSSTLLEVFIAVMLASNKASYLPRFLKLLHQSERRREKQRKKRRVRKNRRKGGRRDCWYLNITRKRKTGRRRKKRKRKPPHKAKCRQVVQILAPKFVPKKNGLETRPSLFSSPFYSFPSISSSLDLFSSFPVVVFIPSFISFLDFLLLLLLNRDHGF